MAYEVTATRKRPQTFDSVVGQQFVVTTLMNFLDEGKIAHAYLFSGPRGIGKTSLARILAKALNCEHGPTSHPCGECVNCREIARGNAVDVIEIDGASNTSVNDVRVIKEEVLFPPQSSRYKIYIIDEVHMLSTSAFNALLKTIEEPPEYVVFIFATTENQKVPATIRSRCQQFYFQLIPLEMIQEVLADLAAEIGVEAENEALFWIAKESTGSLRDAYTLFDQVASFCAGQITMEKIQQKLGLMGIDHISDIVGMLLDGTPSQAISLVHQRLAAGVSVEQCIKDFAEYFRMLLLVRRGVDTPSILGIQKSRIPPRIIDAYSAQQLEAALGLFLQLYRDIRFSASPSFELDLAVSRLVNLPRMVSSAILVERMAQLKEELVRNKEARDISQEAAQLPVQRTSARPREKFTIQMLNELVRQLAEQRDPLAMILGQVRDILQEGETLTLIFSNSYSLENAKKQEETIRMLIRQQSGYEGMLLFGKSEKQDDDRQRKTADDTVKTIATLFRGDII